MNYLLVDTATPATTNRMLHTLEGKTSGSASSSALVQSTSGANPMDCGTEGTTLVCFLRTRATFTGVTYPASGATTHYLTGLAANTTYAISGAGAPSSAMTDSGGILIFEATGTGSITVGAGGSSGAAFSGSVVLSGHVVIQ